MKKLLLLLLIFIMLNISSHAFRDSSFDTTKYYHNVTRTHYKKITKDNFKLEKLDKKKVYRLRYIRINDPRLPVLDDIYFASYLNKLRKNIRDELGFEVEFINRGKFDIFKFFNFHGDLFKLHDVINYVEENQIDLDTAEGRAELEMFIDRKEETINISKINENFFGDEKLNDIDKAKKYIYNNCLKRFQKIRRLKIDSNRYLISKRDRRIHKKVYWKHIMRYILGVDFIVTNTILFGPNKTMGIYTANRGSVVTGFVSNNPHSSVNVTVLMSVFPIITKIDFFNRKRKPIPEDKLTDVLALYSTHEFGHMLNRYAEHYDKPSCIMVAEFELDYYSWYLDKINNDRYDGKLRIIDGFS